MSCSCYGNLFGRGQQLCFVYCVVNDFGGVFEGLIGMMMLGNLVMMVDQYICFGKFGFDLIVDLRVDFG